MKWFRCRVQIFWGWGFGYRYPWGDPDSYCPRVRCRSWLPPLLALDDVVFESRRICCACTAPFTDGQGISLTSLEKGLGLLEKIKQVDFIYCQSHRVNKPTNKEYLARRTIRRQCRLGRSIERVHSTLPPHAQPTHWRHFDGAKDIRSILRFRHGWCWAS